MSDEQTNTSAPSIAADRMMQQLLERIRTQASPDQQDAIVSFARAYTRRIPSHELDDLGIDHLVEMVRSTFEFVDSRGTHACAVRVFDPEGSGAIGTVVESITDDSPFLVDSVSEELVARNLTVSRLLHPVIGTARNEDGRLERVLSARDAAHRESVMHFELDRHLSDGERADLEQRVEKILRDVRLVVRDFEPMRERVKHMTDLARSAAVRYAPREVGETVDFLDWLLQLNFVLLGYREYDLTDAPEGRSISAVPGSGLGILSEVKRSTFAESTRLDSLPPALRARIEDGDLLVFSKTNAYATVHRRARMDYIGVRRVNPEGRIVGEARLIGLFTSKAYMEPAARRRRCCTTSSNRSSPRRT